MIQSKWGFSLGQRVQFVDTDDPDHGVKRGQTGTICSFEAVYGKTNVGVDWDETNDRYHDCRDTCEYGHGWWVPYTSIAVIDVDIGEIQRSDTAIESLIGLF